MPTLNKVTLIGHLGSDPEIKTVPPNGANVGNVSLATSENWTDKEEKKHDRTEWHKLVIWGRQAEIAQEYLKKGSLIYVEGKIQSQTWEDQSGTKRTTTEINVREFLMLDKVNLNDIPRIQRAKKPTLNGPGPSVALSSDPVDDDLPF